MLTKTALKTLFELWKEGGFSVVFWDGEEVCYGTVNPAFKIIFHREPKLSDVKEDIILTLGEAYVKGIIDFVGPLDNVIATMFKNSNDKAKADFKLQALARQLKEVDESVESLNIHKHYDLGNDFFSLWLDKTMVQRAEINRKTVIEFDPTCGQSDEYMQLAKKIDGNDMFIIPKPMEQERLEQLLMEFGILG